MSAMDAATLEHVVTPEQIGLCWPCGVLHSSDPRWKPSSDMWPLLAFVEGLILDLARTHATVTQADVAGWLAAVAVGGRSHRGRS
jgi:hypothetical protein